MQETVVVVVVDDLFPSVPLSFAQHCLRFNVRRQLSTSIIRIMTTQVQREVRIKDDNHLMIKVPKWCRVFILR